MAETRNNFAETLSAYDAPTLREAFERANNRADNKLHRTTLSRWLDGSFPTNGEFIRLLAEELNDPELFTTWESVRGSKGATGYRSVVTRFEGLSPDDRSKAYAEIRRSYLMTVYPKILERLSYRVEIKDPVDPDGRYLVVQLRQEYDSSLPARAQIRFGTTAAELGDSYETENCVFRELLAFQKSELAEHLEGMPAPSLAYNRLDGSQTMVTPAGQWLQDGVFEFENERVDRARIRLRLEYPLPSGTHQYIIRFGEFRVAGGAEFTLALNSPSISAPEVFPFLPAGRQREWAANLVRPNELVASIGAGGTILADGDGLLLSWSTTG